MNTKGQKMRLLTVFMLLLALSCSASKEDAGNTTKSNLFVEQKIDSVLSNVFWCCDSEVEERQLKSLTLAGEKPYLIEEKLSLYSLGLELYKIRSIFSASYNRFFILRDLSSNAFFLMPAKASEEDLRMHYSHWKSPYHNLYYFSNHDFHHFEDFLNASEFISNQGLDLEGVDSLLIQHLSFRGLGNYDAPKNISKITTEDQLVNSLRTYEERHLLKVSDQEIDHYKEHLKMTSSFLQDVLAVNSRSSNERISYFQWLVQNGGKARIIFDGYLFHILFVYKEKYTQKYCLEYLAV
ncbi:hypothetical protein [Saprospira grandis]|uniref:Lipoprotein n=1 Tax=Saprospira grandis (strain Lewin) TaxID=984262 RepID=H6L7H9_SAPGL|nr:hypothetical protein [Saprospira grandis]AFC26930.1 hypothetical protein SGRA_4215 [Saprospira grandis str. Lewin]